MSKHPLFFAQYRKYAGVTFGIIRLTKGRIITLDDKYLWFCHKSGDVKKVCETFVRMGKRNKSQ